MAEKKLVAIDIGASQTRCSDWSGVINYLPNNMVLLEAESHLEGRSELSRSIEMVVTSSNTNYEGVALVGEMAKRHGGDLVPGSKNKLDQKINYMSILLGIATQLVEGGSTGEEEEDVELYLALPPIEVGGDKVQGLIGQYEIDFPKWKEPTVKGGKVRFRISKVSDFGESALTLMSHYFNVDGSDKNDGEDKVVLAVDIGASTVDLAVADNMQYLDVSGNTLKFGGNMCIKHIQDEIKRSQGYELPNKDADRIIKTGMKKVGGGNYQEAGDIVVGAKKMLASNIVSRLDGYLQGIGIPLQSIDEVIVSGGGSLASENKEGKCVESVAHFIGEELDKSNSQASIIEYGVDARDANIKGLLISALVDSM